MLQSHRTEPFCHFRIRDAFKLNTFFFYLSVVQFHCFFFVCYSLSVKTILFGKKIKAQQHNSSFFLSFFKKNKTKQIKTTTIFWITIRPDGSSTYYRPPKVCLCPCDTVSGTSEPSERLWILLTALPVFDYCSSA